MNRAGRVLTIAVAVAALTALTAGPVAAKPSGAGSGNSLSAKSCQKNGWQTLVTSSGQSFTSEEACTSYAANGGTLYTTAEAPCLNGGYANYTTSSGQTFTSQSACVSYVDSGGTLKPINWGQQWTTTCTGANGDASTSTSEWECDFLWTTPLESGPSGSTISTLAQECANGGGLFLDDGARAEGPSGAGELWGHNVFCFF